MPESPPSPALERAPRRLGRIALRCWLIAVGLFVAAVVVGFIVSILGPGTDSVQTYAPLVFPALVSLVSVPLFVASVVISIRSFVVEGLNGRALAAHVLSLIALLPAGFIFFHVVALLTGNG